MAAALAKSLNVGQLVLTHYSQRYKPQGAVTEVWMSVKVYETHHSSICDKYLNLAVVTAMLI